MAGERRQPLSQLVEAVAPAQVLGDSSVEIGELAYRAHDVVPGALFLCVRGARADGHDFAPLALERGAVALLVERPLDFRVPQVVVPNARIAMPRLADEFFGRPSAELDVLGVTGTNGKTTTAFLLYEILLAAGRSPGLLGTIESRVGGERRPAVRTTPESVDLQRTLREMLDTGNRSCALEATSHGSELGRLDRVRFRALAFTNLTQDHLDFHGDMERYFAAKRRLFGDAPAAAVNIGDPWGRRLADELRREARAALVTYGFAEDADVRPVGLELDSRGARFRVDGIDVATHLRGRFNVENALAALCLARLARVEGEAIAAGLAAARGVPGRFEPVDEGQAFTVVVDYAHTPDSLATALANARELAGGRVVCVFGCGGDRDRAKRPLMGRVAAERSDVAIVTSDNPRSEDPRAIVEEVLAGAQGRLEVELDRRAAIERAVEEARSGDVVLIAGKGHEQGQEVAGETRPFDDRRVAREALRQLRSRA
ncbi:MAG: UDP-N-acetylmuramoyl-L-alanyl-D-glutamate--2,6-diaminopimelate ligase [Actinomycetota bacterium]|nr:UDP-N-acetylmuramoyl-L-alanyl-D-glutamate--2,6-diaminopimelate ligase [Actinomycetota bacterium]